jgi:uncharacterized protein YukE
MERLRLRAKEEDEVVIERFASEVKRMRTAASQLHASRNTLRASMKKTAEENGRQTTRRMQGKVAELQGDVAQLQSRFGQLRKQLEGGAEKLKENTRQRIAQVWGSHKPGTSVADII